MLEAIQIERSPTVSRIIKLWAKGIKLTLTSTMLCFHADYFKRNVCFAELCIESWHFNPSLSLFALKCMKWLHWRLLFPMSNCSCITHNVILPIPIIHQWIVRVWNGFFRTFSEHKSWPKTSRVGLEPVSILNYPIIGSSIKQPSKNLEATLVSVNWGVFYPKSSYKIPFHLNNGSLNRSENLRSPLCSLHKCCQNFLQSLEN